MRRCDVFGDDVDRVVAEVGGYRAAEVDESAYTIVIWSEQLPHGEGTLTPLPPMKGQRFAEVIDTVYERAMQHEAAQPEPAG